MATKTKDSINTLLSDLREGDQQAAQKLWERYCLKLVAVARRKLGTASRRVADEEDIALLAFYSLCDGIQKNRFPRLADRDDLWKILLVITERKVIDHVRGQQRQKRGGGAVRGESAFGLLGDGKMARGIERVMDTEPTPDYVNMAMEQCHELMNALPSEELRQIALWKLEGWNNTEIAEKLGCITKTVGRKLRQIRAIWSDLLGQNIQ
jgi:DNA-directed RNA polymerase specialized sigma24 family protein